LSPVLRCVYAVPAHLGTGCALRRANRPGESAEVKRTIHGGVGARVATQAGEEMARRIWTALGLSALTLGLTTISCAYAQGADADWKMYGTFDLANVGGMQDVFFDAANVVRKDGGQVEVWTKTLSVKALKSFDSAPASLHQKVAETAVQKLRAGYRPPISKMTELDDGATTAIIALEVIADLAVIEPTTRILYEFDCPNRLVRELSTHVLFDGKLQTQDTPAAWKHVAPETLIAELLKIVCTR
jgi:hypothetical protein